MSPKELKNLIDGQEIIAKWLHKIGEKDQAVINETLEAMRNPEYCNWILNYARRC